MRPAALASLGMKSSSCPVTGTRSANVTRSVGTAVHISYNPSSAGYGCDTTAIVLRERVFFVLNGNHAEALCSAVEQHGVSGCVEYFVQNISQANGRSEHLMATGLAEDLFGLLPTTIEVLGQGAVARIASASSATPPIQ